MGLITFEGKPIEKLIEVISQGIGTLHKPRAIRKEADAEAYKLKVIEKAKAEVIAETKLIEFDTLDLIEQRIIHQQLIKQSNIDNIIKVAAEQINQEDTVSSEQVDRDWTTRFFNISEDICNDEMQKLWGRILAGEVKQPGTFSLRALEALKNLTKEEAQIFTKFAQLKIDSNDAAIIPYTDTIYLNKELNISYKEILLMSELGLIMTSSDLSIILKGTGKTIHTLFKNGETGIFIDTSPNNQTFSMKVLFFTNAGSELSTLISYERNEKYLSYACKSLTTPYSSIKYGKLGVENGNTVLINPIDYIKVK